MTIAACAATSEINTQKTGVLRAAARSKDRDQPSSSPAPPDPALGSRSIMKTDATIPSAAAETVKATAEKRPVLFVTAHFGNHEAPRQILTRMGHSVGGLYRPFTNPYFDADYRRTIGALGGTVFAQGRRGTIGLIRYLREANQGVLFYDVFYGAGEKLDFLGKPAMTALSAAEIAIKVNAVVLPYYGVRNPDGMTFTAIIDAPIAASDPISMTKEMNARLETQIAAHPEQWFWVHRRWKMRKV